MINIYSHVNIKYEQIRRKNPDKVYFCNCGKQFKHASSLWNHKQKCIPTQESVDDEQEIPAKPTDSAMILELLKQNQEFKSLFI